MNFDLNGLLNTPDTTDSFDQNDISLNKNFAILACLAILFWVPLVSNAKSSPFARYYANQGAILLVFIIIACLVGVLPLIGWLFRDILLAIGLLEMIFLFVNSSNGRAKEMPIIGGLFQLIR